MTFQNTSRLGSKKSSQSASETIALGREIAKSLQPGDCLALHGELGAGKTTLTKGIIAELCNLAIDEITSPTYAYVQSYGNVNHFDCYRLENSDIFARRGLDESINPDTISLIEWPEKIEPYLPVHTKHITIRRNQDEKREIEIHG